MILAHHQVRTQLEALIKKKTNRWEVARQHRIKSQKGERKLHRERVRSIVMHRSHFLALFLSYHPFLALYYALDAAVHTHTRT